MSFCRKTIWTLVSVAILFPAGCASQRGRMARKNEINTAQLLAAARQYEKEGQLANAAHIYQHVLKYHPANFEAKEGLALVQQGKLRVDYDTETLLASTDPLMKANPQARQQLARLRKEKRAEVTERMADLIASAAENPRTITVDAAPTQALVASATQNPTQPRAFRTAVVNAKPITDLIPSVPSTPSIVSAPVAVSKPVVEHEPVAAAKPEIQPEPVAAAKPEIQPEPVEQPARQPLESATAPIEPAVAPESKAVAQADAVAPDQRLDQIETTAFDKPVEMGDEEPVPAGWTDSGWQKHSPTNHCKDASAAVLTEVKKLESETDDVRKEGLINLSLMGPEAKSALTLIRQRLYDSNQLIAAHAAWAVWEIDGDASTAVETLSDLLESHAHEVVQFSAYTLGNMGEDAGAALPELHKLLSSENSLAKLHAAEAISQIGGEAGRADAVDTLIILLKDKDANVRSLAAMTLGQADEANAMAAVAALTSALDDESDTVRAAAALSLGGYGSAAEIAVERLEQVAEKDHTSVREAARMALACIRL